ncbi:MAG: sigma-54-dependent transcriptional regulator [Planctomycetaceae bacterium]
MNKLLIVDDEPSIRYSIEQVFDGQDVEVLTADNAEDAVRIVASQSPDVVLLDIRLGNQDGLEVFYELRKHDPRCLVVFITGHGTSETAIEAMKRGAYDYLVKPLDANQITQVVHQACEISRLMRRPAIVEESEHPSEKPDLLIGSGAAMRAVCKQIGRVASQDVNVLILGESGTGKELVARVIYQHSRREDKPFLAINCAALPEALLESELFGHEKGAFTGADRRRIGKFEHADGGTLFLDEIGDMNPNTQAKMLRLLQEGTFERVGGNESLRANVRIISATNQNLETMIEQGKFRLDLYYRLRGVTVSLPPLRERREDIPELAHYFLFRFNRELGTNVISISEEAIQRLQEYTWPGNIREFQIAIREGLIRSAGSHFLPEFLPEEVLREPAAETPALPDSHARESSWDTLAQQMQSEISAGQAGVYRRALEHFDRILVTTALGQTGGNQAAAAELLGLSRPTLRAKIRGFQATTKGLPPAPATAIGMERAAPTV